MIRIIHKTISKARSSYSLRGVGAADSGVKERWAVELRNAYLQQQQIQMCMESNRPGRVCVTPFAFPSFIRTNHGKDQTCDQPFYDCYVADAYRGIFLKRDEERPVKR